MMKIHFIDGEQRILHLAAGDVPPPPTYNGMPLLPGFRIDADTGRPTSRSMPERDWAKQFWEKTYAATKDYYAVAGKAADLLNNHS